MKHATIAESGLTQEMVRTCLRSVCDPYSGLDIVTLGWVAQVSITPSQVTVALTPPDRIWTTRAAVQIAMERALHTCLAAAQRSLDVRWEP